MRDLQFAIYLLFVTLQVERVFGIKNVTVGAVSYDFWRIVTGRNRIDTSNYNIIGDSRENNFSFFDAKCRGELRFKMAFLNAKALHFKRGRTM